MQDNNNNNGGKSVFTAIVVFLFMTLATVFILLYTGINLWYLIGLVVFFIIAWAVGYGTPAFIGLIVGIMFWFFGLASGIIGWILHPFGITV